MAAMRSHTPPMWPVPPATLDSTMVAMRPGPTTMIRPRLRRIAQGKPGRRAIGTSQTEFTAFCMALATPRAPKNVRSRPRNSASPVCCRPWRLVLSCGPMTGYCERAECSTWSRSEALFFRTMSSTVTSTRSSGKIEANA